MLPNAGDCFARRYRIERAIGRGAMGVVYEAVHETLGTHVAIKVLRSDTVDERSTRRFLREAKLASRLHSEHVVRVLDVDSAEDGTPYLVMELLEGRDLAAETEVRGDVPAAEAIRWMLAVCSAMKEAHAAGIVHRDLKLSNVFLCTDGRVKVLDFGVAALGRGETDASTFTDVAGTPRYMAPEQLLGETPDPRSDVWAVGVMLYRLAAGRFPYEAPTPAAQMLAIMDGCPPLATLGRNISERLSRAVQHALGRTLEERCPSIDVLHAELDAVLADGEAPSTALASTPPAPAAASTRRTPAPLVAAVAFGLLVAGAFAWGMREKPETKDAPPRVGALASTPLPVAAPGSVTSDVPPAASASVVQTPARPVPAPPARPKATAAAPKDDGFPAHL